MTEGDYYIIGRGGKSRLGLLLLMAEARKPPEPKQDAPITIISRDEAHLIPDLSRQPSRWIPPTVRERRKR